MLAERIKEQRTELQDAQRRLGDRQAQFQVTRRKMQTTADEWRNSLREVAALIEQDGPPRGVTRPYSRLSKARQRVAVRWRRLQRRSQEVERARQAIARQNRKVHRLQTELASLEVCLAHLVEENRTNRAPVRAIFRLDGGFGSGENLAFLIGMGYEVYGKAISDKVAGALRRRVTAQTNDCATVTLGEHCNQVPHPALTLLRFPSILEDRTT